MKKVILDNIKEFILIVIVYLLVTFLLSRIFDRDPFDEFTLVYLITLAITKIIYTIYVCKRKK